MLDADEVRGRRSIILTNSEVARTPDDPLAKHVRRLSDACGASLQCEPIQIVPHRLDAGWNELWNEVTKIRTEVRRPLTVGIDLTSCDLNVALGLIGRLTGIAAAKEFRVFYAEGHYLTRPPKRISISFSLSVTGRCGRSQVCRIHGSPRVGDYMWCRWDSKEPEL